MWPFRKGIKLRDGSKTEDRRLGRLKQFDERSRLYGIRALVGQERLLSKKWNCSLYNDRGQEGACVGFAWSHELSASPFVKRSKADVALKIYNRGKQIDPWEGEDYEGTSVLAGAKATQELLNSKGASLMPEYRWAFGLEDLVLALGNHGPAVLGVNWYSGMSNPDRDGFIHVSGRLSGGHAILAKGVRLYFNAKARTFENLDLERSYVTLHNSWGDDWGVNGSCYISLADLGRLLDEDGECCIPVIRNK